MTEIDTRTIVPTYEIESQIAFPETKRTRMVDIEERVESGITAYKGAYETLSNSVLEVAEGLRELRSMRANDYYGWTWKEYCENRFKFGNDRGGQVLRASQIIVNILDSKEYQALPEPRPVPANERSVRPIGDQHIEPESQGVVYVTAVTLAKGKPPTNQQVKAAIQQVRTVGGRQLPVQIHAQAILDQSLERAKEIVRQLDRGRRFKLAEYIETLQYEP